MFKLVIQDDEGKTTVVPLIRDEITIGRKEGNTIRLTERNVSRRHARILRNNGEVHIEDLGSYNGIRVNNARIAERVSLRVSDQVQIGDYKLYLKAEGLDQVDESRTTPMERVEPAGPTDSMPAVMTGVGGTPTPVPALPTVPPMIGNPNRTMVAIADTDPGRTVGPVTQAAVAALTAPGGYGKLVVLSSNFAGKEFELSRPQMIIGRTDENDIVINHRSISRNHAKLVREPETGRYTISDLQSSNGVRVNGSDYGKVELRRGDVVDLGHVRLRFVDAGEDFVFARDAVITDVPEAGGRRGMLFAVIAAILVLVGAGFVYMMHQRRDEQPVAPAPGVGPSGSGPAEPGDTVAATGPETPQPGSAAVVTPTVPPTADDAAIATVQRPTVKPDDDKAQQQAQIVKCTETVVQKDWTALGDCATALRGLGAAAKADEFQNKAKQELQNSMSDGDARAAMRQGKLKDAVAILQKIGSSSVYFKSLSDTITKMENAQVDDARRKAQSLAILHDCNALKSFVRGLAQGNNGTERVVNAAGAVKCVNGVAAVTSPPENPTPPKPPNGSGGDGNSGGSGQVTPAKSNVCDAINVDDAMTQAANQFNAGFFPSALALVMKALGCRQDVKMYRVAVTYACSAHNAAAAKLYFPKVPAQYQSSLVQKCLQEGIALP